MMEFKTHIVTVGQRNIKAFQANPGNSVCHNGKEYRTIEILVDPNRLPEWEFQHISGLHLKSYEREEVMPLDKSGSKESVSKNIKAEEAAGKPHKQAVAIALDTQRGATKKKGK